MPRPRRPRCAARPRGRRRSPRACCCGSRCPATRRPARRPRTPPTATSCRTGRTSTCRPRVGSPSSWRRSTASTATAPPYTLTKPTYTVADAAFGPLGDETMISPRLAPQVIGVGLLEAVPEETILRRRRSRRRRRRRDLGAPEHGLGRSAPSRTRSAASGGRPTCRPSSSRSPGRSSATSGSRRRCTRTRTARPARPHCAAAISGGEPELTDDRLAAVTFYGRTLAVPAMRGCRRRGRAGRRRAVRVAAAARRATPRRCTTGETDIAALSDQEIHPYTDLLLHDMGPDLSDGRPDFDAAPEEWRTPPLWGIGIVDDVNGAPVPAPRRAGRRRSRRRSCGTAVRARRRPRRSARRRRRTASAGRVPGGAVTGRRRRSRDGRRGDGRRRVLR